MSLDDRIDNVPAGHTSPSFHPHGYAALFDDSVRSEANRGTDRDRNCEGDGRICSGLGRRLDSKNLPADRSYTGTGDSRAGTDTPTSHLLPPGSRPSPLRHGSLSESTDTSTLLSTPPRPPARGTTRRRRTDPPR